MCADVRCGRNTADRAAAARESLSHSARAPQTEPHADCGNSCSLDGRPGRDDVLDVWRLRPAGEVVLHRRCGARGDRRHPVRIDAALGRRAGWSSLRPRAGMAVSRLRQLATRLGDRWRPGGDRVHPLGGSGRGPGPDGLRRPSAGAGALVSGAIGAIVSNLSQDSPSTGPMISDDGSLRAASWRSPGMTERDSGPSPPDLRRRVVLIVALLTIYLGAHLFLRLVISDSVDVDESDILLFSQSLEWGYHEQPPLYSWCVWPLTQLFGASIFTITLFRLLVLGAIHILLYFATLRLTRDGKAALLAAFAPLAVPTLAWNAIFYLTHTLLACALGVATFHALLRLRDEGRTRDYLLLGLVVGLGGMSKYNFALLAAALLVAALSVSAFRMRLLDRRIVLSMLVAALVVAPHALWLLHRWEEIRQGLAFKTALGEGGFLSGVSSLAKNGFIILLPLVPLFVVCFPQVLRRREEEPPSPQPSPPEAGGEGVRRAVPLGATSCASQGRTPLPPLRGEWGRGEGGCRSNPESALPHCDAHGRTLLVRYFLVVAAILLAQVAFGGVSRFHERWLQPLRVSAPAFVSALPRPTDLVPRRCKCFAGLLAACAIGFLVVRASQIWHGGLDRGRYPLQMALAEPAAQLRHAGFEHATIVAHDREIAGNLRLMFPQARILCAAQPLYVPPQLPSDGPYFLVWNVQMGADINPPPTLERFAVRVLPWQRDAAAPVTVVALPPRMPDRPTNYLLVTPVVPSPGVVLQR